MTRAVGRVLGALAVGCYAAHAATHLGRGHPEDLLWACHLGALAAGLGLLAGQPALHGIGFLWLCMGNVLWWLDLAGGGEFIPTSALTHLGGLCIGAVGLGRLGMPAGTWWKAILGFLALQQLCRWLTPETANVNLAHAVWTGWESVFRSYLAYQVLLVAIGSLAFAIAERSARALIRVRSR